MNYYEICAFTTFVLLLKHSSRDVVGSIFLAMLWPVVVTALGYYGIKKFVFKKHGPSPKFFELEFLFHLIVGTSGFIIISYAIGDERTILFVRALFG